MSPSLTPRPVIYDHSVVTHKNFCFNHSLFPGRPIPLRVEDHKWNTHVVSHMTWTGPCWSMTVCDSREGGSYHWRSLTRFESFSLKYLSPRTACVVAANLHLRLSWPWPSKKKNCLERWCGWVVRLHGPARKHERNSVQHRWTRSTEAKHGCAHPSRYCTW